MSAHPLLITTQRAPCAALPIGSNDASTVEAMVRLIQAAVALVNGGKEPGIQRVAKVIGVPHSVLYAYVNGDRVRANAPYPLLYTLHCLATAPAQVIAEAFKLANMKRRLRYRTIRDVTQDVTA